MAYIRQLAAAALLALLAACAAPGAQDSVGGQPGPAGSDAPAPAPARTGSGPEPTPAPVPATPGKGAVPVVDRSCRSDADCAVKNVGNCCGYYPACVNKDSPTDPAAVQAQCKASGMMSVCGFPDISSCSCNAGTCEAAGTGAAPAVQ